MFHLPAIFFAIVACAFWPLPSSLHSVLVRSSPLPSAHWQPTQLQSVRVCVCVCPASASKTTAQCVFHVPSISATIIAKAIYFCTSEQKSLCSLPISHRHRNQCLCILVRAFHPPAIHRCNQCVCVQHPRRVSNLCVPPATIRTCAFYFYTSKRKSCMQSTQSQSSSQSVLVDSMVCIPLCASILLVLPADNHTNAITACVSYTRIRHHSPKCASTCRAPPGCACYLLFLRQWTKITVQSTHQPSPSQSALVHSILCVSSTVNRAIAVSACMSCMRQQPQLTACPIGPPSPLQSLLVLSISAPVSKNHCALHPSAITITISACPFQSVHSTHRQSTVAISACVCVCPIWVRSCSVYPSGITPRQWVPACPASKPQSKVCSTLCFLFLHQWAKIIVT